MTTEAKVGAFVIASLLSLGSATYFVHNTQTGARAGGLQDAPALCRRHYLWSGRALWRHQGGPGDRRGGPGPKIRLESKSCLR